VKVKIERAEFARAYASAFAAHLDDGSESALRTAYELGRTAVAAGLSVLDLAAVHHETLLDATAESGTARAAERVVAAAGDFFLESLSAFEMVQRGFREANEATMVEKRQTAMLRRLSSFLADTSLAVSGPDALEEVLQLVAEHARELVAARWCLASFDVAGGPPLVAVAPSAPPAGVEPRTLLDLASRVGGADGHAGEAASAAFARLLGAEGPVRGRLAAQLRGLDGRKVGSVQLFEKANGEFNDVDQAVLVHVAQMAAAAVERAQLYARGTPSG
jgi:hypothetical protein